MELVDQLIPIDFGLGIDQSADKKQVMPGKMAQLQNVRLTKAKQLSKRYGYARQGTVANPFVARNLDVLGSRPFGYFPDVRGTGIAVKPNASYGGGAVAGLGVSGICAAQTAKVIGGGGASEDQAQVDSAIIGTVKLYVWKTGPGKVFYMPVDTDSGQPLAQARELDAGNTKLRVRVVACNGVFVVGATHSTANQLRFYVYNPTTGAAIGAAASSVGTVAGSVAWDFAAYNTFVVYTAYTAANTLTVGRLDNTGTSLGTTTFATAAAVSDAAVCIPAVSSSALARILWSDNSTGLYVRYFVSTSLAAGALGGTNRLLDATFSAVANDPIGAVEHSGQTTFGVVHAINNATVNLRSTRVLGVADGAPPTILSGYPETLRTVVPYSKPFFVTNANNTATDLCFLAQYASPTNAQNTYFLIARDYSGGIVTQLCRPVAKSFAGSAALTAPYALTSMCPVGSTFTMAAAFYANARLFGGQILAGSTMVDVAFDFSLNGSTMPSAELADARSIAAGFIAQYDSGGSIIEHGFALFPEGITATPGAGGALSAGTYQYKVVWEWTDESGHVHRSADSVAVSVTVTAGQKVDLVIPNLRMTLKDPAYPLAPRSAIVVAIYRTAANGSTFYRVSNVAGPTAVINSVTAASATFSDTTITDAALISNEVVYTQGGELANFVPDGSVAIAASDERIFVADPLDDGVVWPSKPMVAGQGISWAQEIQMRLASEDGPVLAIAVQDSNIIAFKRNSAYVASGDGPDATGQFGSFSSFEKIPTDGGCRRQSACATTPLGTLTYTFHGFHLLGRDLSWNYVGKAVKDFETQDCVSMVHVPSQKEVRCLMSSGVILTFNYEYPDQFGPGQWFTSSFNGLDATFAQDGSVYVINGDATNQYVVYSEDSTRFTDQALGNAGADRNIAMLLETAWIDIATKNGYQRLRAIFVLGEFLSTHNLTIQIAYDHSDTYEAATWTVVGANLVAGGAAYRVKIQPRIQKCTSFRLKITDDGAGAACTLTTMTAKIAVKKGGAKLRAANRV